MIKDGRTNTSRICTSDTPGAKLARLHYKILRTQESSALAEVTLDTGRHHQIRVQMAHIGCPIIKDTKYNLWYLNSRLIFHQPAAILNIAYSPELLSILLPLPLPFPDIFPKSLPESSLSCQN